MSSQKTKRKRINNEDADQIDTANVHTEGKPKKPKKSKKTTQPFSAKDAAAEIVHQATEQPKKKKKDNTKSAMSEEIAREVAAYVALHESDTPEEARLRRKEARQRLGSGLDVSGVRSDAKLAEMLIRQRKENEMRMLKMYEIIPMERSLRTKTSKSGTNIQENVEENIKIEVEMSYNGDNNDDSIRSTIEGSEARVRQMATEPQLQRCKGVQSRPAVESPKADDQKANPEASSCSSTISDSINIQKPNAPDDVKPEMQMKLPEQQGQPHVRKPTFPSGAVPNASALPDKVPVRRTEPEMFEGCQTSARQYEAADSHAVKAESSVGSRHLYVDSKYLTAVVGQDGARD